MSEFNIMYSFPPCTPLLNKTIPAKAKMLLTKAFSWEQTRILP